MAGCTHVDRVQVQELPESVEGCEDCLAVEGAWFHLRICLECGKVGCCDDSPARHMTQHHEETGHLLIRSLEPGEVWAYCYADDTGLLLPNVKGETQIPPSPLA